MVVIMRTNSESWVFMAQVYLGADCWPSVYNRLRRFLNWCDSVTALVSLGCAARARFPRTPVKLLRWTEWADVVAAGRDGTLRPTVVSKVLVGRCPSEWVGVREHLALVSLAVPPIWPAGAHQLLARTVHPRVVEPLRAVHFSERLSGGGGASKGTAMMCPLRATRRLRMLRMLSGAHSDRSPRFLGNAPCSWRSAQDYLRKPLLYLAEPEGATRT